MKVKTTIIEEEKDSIQEVIIDLNLNEAGVTTYITDRINGILECILVETDKPINMMISSADTDGMFLFDTKNNSINGFKYLSLTTYATTKQFELVGYSAEKWVLNDRLRFEIIGPSETTIKIKVRYR